MASKILKRDRLKKKIFDVMQKEIMRYEGSYLPINCLSGEAILRMVSEKIADSLIKSEEIVNGII